jgi:hypothetical protein
MPSSASDAGAVAVDGRESIPSKLAACREVVALELTELAPFGVPLAPPFPVFDGMDELASPCAVQDEPRSLVGEGPADPFASKHAEPDGDPAAPLPSEPFAEKSSEAEDGWVPQLVPRLASVGMPGAASPVEHVDRYVGSSAEPTPATDPANEPVMVATAFALTRESEVDMDVRLASAFAAGPDVVGAEPSGVDPSGSDADAVVGTVAVVPGLAAVVEPCAGAFGLAVFELDAVIGLLDATVAGPALPPFAEAEPPRVELCASGRTSGCAVSVGLSAKARSPQTFRTATATMKTKSFLII